MEPDELCRSLASEVLLPGRELDDQVVDGPQLVERLLRLGGSITAGSASPMSKQRVGDALDASLSFDEVVGSVLALTPTIGIERVVAIAPDLARALGYDVDAALERLDDPTAPARRSPRVGSSS
ncbi:MAG: hypothetical protein A2Z32_01730 [Chloroflexi bacterium RBG_16_69_14]|nr:MAG: hypothetical protein A2Z32_01730 [Chloroflexi bacterium RBG_16_69_14]